MMKTFQAAAVISSFIILFSFFPALAREKNEGNIKTENVVLITLDGLRWQELFFGADPVLINNSRYTKNIMYAKSVFWDKDNHRRRKKLLPFIWDSVYVRGQLYGNRTLGCSVNTANQYRISYPGYNEILTGSADDENITSNNELNNPNLNILELAVSLSNREIKAAAFTSWSMFPLILNQERNGIYMISGNSSAYGENLTKKETWLNEISSRIPYSTSSGRPDVFTFNYALEYMKRERPRLVFISFGETDEFAHEGNYMQYLISARNNDSCIEALWKWIQSDSSYSNKTTLIITTDHGRGEKNKWKDHGRRVKGSDEAWIAVIGPDTPNGGEMGMGIQVYLNQIARTIALLLQLDLSADKPMGEAIKEVTGN